jgi:hypothetical protein
MNKENIGHFLALLDVTDNPADKVRAPAPARLSLRREVVRQLRVRTSLIAGCAPEGTGCGCTGSV